MRFCGFSIRSSASGSDGQLIFVWRIEELDEVCFLTVLKKLYYNMHQSASTLGVS